ncbi:MAG TPA: AAA family ATPase [Novimethylophilus sp.]|jgi:MSHA biogenesis protein MshM|uniref:ExeA family protein n=1 Tax=Novimethylophilus sp. TaxID=2137426 RepID=UPI002F424896
MYLEHFGLRESPFNITPDTAFFFASARYQEALNTLLIAARTGEGFMKITGEVGTGKTLLCRKFISSLDETFKVAYIPNPYLEPHSLLLALAEELGIEIVDTGQHHLLKSITQALTEFSNQGRQVIICLDEAQAMPLETMEALRLLTNLETEKRKLLQVVIFGQPELEDKLNQQSIRQLKQRITFDYRLSPLNRDDLHYYLNHRLIVAGYQGGRLFSSWALWMLHRRTEGIPRLVNIVAHKAMLAVFGKGRKTVGMADVMAACNDTASTRKMNWRFAALLGVLIAVLAAAVMWNATQ